MPVSTIATRRSDYFDKLTELRSPALGAVAATTSETSVNLLEVAVDDFQCVLYGTAYTGYVQGTANWTITVEASTVAASGFISVATVTLDGTNKKLQLPLDGLFNDQLVPGATYLRVTATKFGAPGNLTYGAYLSAESDYDA